MSSNNSSLLSNYNKQLFIFSKITANIAFGTIFEEVKFLKRTFANTLYTFVERRSPLKKNKHIQPKSRTDQVFLYFEVLVPVMTSFHRTQFFLLYYTGSFTPPSDHKTQHVVLLSYAGPDTHCLVQRRHETVKEDDVLRLVIAGWREAARIIEQKKLCSVK